MAKKKSQEKHSQVEELLENPEALAEKFSKTEDFIENNKTLVFSVVGVIALVIASFFVFKYYVDNQNSIAQAELFQAVYYFESDSLELALKGDGNNYGFVEIIDKFGMTEAANLANLYAGAAYLQQGAFPLAVVYLKEFSSDDLLLQARAYSLLGDAYMEQGRFADASEQYDMAADYKPNEFFTPVYLMKAALAYEKLADTAKAKERYATIVDEFKTSNEYQTAAKELARLGS